MNDDPEDFNWVPNVDQCHENNFMLSGNGNPMPDKESLWFLKPNIAC